MKKIILFIGLSLAIISSTVETINANEVDSKCVNKEVDAKIFLKGIRCFEDEPTMLEASGSVVESFFYGDSYYGDWKIISAFMYKGTLYLRYEDFVDIINPDSFNFRPESDTVVGPYFFEFEKNGKVINVLEQDKELKVNGKITNNNIPIPLCTDFYFESSMYIPVRVVAEAADLKVDFSVLENDYIVTIKDNQED